MTEMQQEIQALNERVAMLNEQVSSLTTRLKAWDELKEDMALFASDAFSGVVQFLQEVDFHFRSEDFVTMMKTFLRNVNNLNKVMNQLQSTVELVDDVRPLVKEMFDELVGKLDALERDGTMDSAKALLKTLRTIQQHFTPEELEKLGLDLVRLLKVATPAPPGHLDMLEKLREAIENYQYDANQKLSLVRVLKKARRPEVLKNLAVLLDLLSSVHLPENGNTTKKGE